MWSSGRSQSTRRHHGDGSEAGARAATWVLRLHHYLSSSQNPHIPQAYAVGF